MNPLILSPSSRLNYTNKPEQRLKGSDWFISANSLVVCVYRFFLVFPWSEQKCEAIEMRNQEHVPLNWTLRTIKMRLRSRAMHHVKVNLTATYGSIFNNRRHQWNTDFYQHVCALFLPTTENRQSMFGGS